MKPNRMTIQNVGQITKAEIGFGDLTVFVGPQATGKSIALEFLKLLVDSGPVRTRLREYGVEWDRDLARFFDIFLGEGMNGVWHEGTSTLTADGAKVDIAALIKKPGQLKKDPSMFFLPAQRVLTLREGWPRPFSDYGPGDPFVVRDFSDNLRLLMEKEFGRSGVLFPKSNRLKSEIRELLADAVFHGFGLSVDKARPQKRLVLAQSGEGDSLPFMVWSAGQREFVPLLLGLYWLFPAAKVSRRTGVEWVVIEELEMGLHPKAINVVLLLVLELLWRGYRVCLSTHSSQVLDMLWALRILQERGGTASDVLDLFQCRRTSPMIRVAETAIKKDARVYLFEQASGRTRDISRLDPGSDDVREAGWGGLTEFSGHVGDIVARVVGRSEISAITKTGVLR
jgi:hypothetical protein